MRSEVRGIPARSRRTLILVLARITRQLAASGLSPAAEK